ncbi:MAG: DUF4105 domain-containing protein [Prolixibacteraceae bacterium]|nr:DUF4105 domain-containing protein [Prolixibacteraceae bacterium]
MHKKFLFAIVLGSLLVNLYASPRPLSDKAQAVLFTCGPGAELYAGFGHSALWIFDPATGIDRLYNYGTFDFNTPNFYLKFIRGKLNYILSVTTARNFLLEYQHRKIEVTGQTLNLNTNELNTMYAFLENNLLPENRFYKYDFFYDNCATRIRDVIENETGSKVTFHTPDQNLKFREMLFPYLEHSPWTKTGVNIILGLTADKKATPWDYMFLPEYMDDAFRTATIESPNGDTRQLVKNERSYLPQKLHFTNKKYDDPFVVFGLMLILGIALSVVEQKTKRYYKIVDVILFSISSFDGLFLLFMWVGTEHVATNYNLNIFWLLPAQALFLAAFFIKKRENQLLFIALIYQAIVSVTMYAWPQETEVSFFFISLFFLVRIFSKISVNTRAKRNLMKS